MFSPGLFIPLQVCILFQNEFCKKRTTYSTIKKILALPFVPADDVSGIFEEISRSSTDRLETFLLYIKECWINSRTYPIPTWNVYGRATRTNNDVEGWHRRLNHLCQDQKPAFYVLVPVLFEESRKLPHQMQMVEEGSLTRNQRKEVSVIILKCYAFNPLNLKIEYKAQKAW